MRIADMKVGRGAAGRGWIACVVVFGLGLGGFARPTIGAEESLPDPGTLVSEMVANQRTRGSRTRVKLSVDPVSGPTRSLQLLIKTRRDGSTNETLVVAMWPKEFKGQAWVLRRADGGQVSGFRFTPPDETRPVTEADLDEPLFGSDLGVDDFAESFWEWPGQRVVGSEKVGNAECWVVESQTSESSVKHPRVRSWLAKGKPVAMRVEKLDRDGTVRKRLTAGRVVRRDEGGWAVAEWLVETLPDGGRTRVAGSRSDRDLVLEAGEFTPDGVRQLLDGKSP